MPTSLEVEREISERAERRKQELREALGGGLLITNNLSFHDKVNYLNETNKPACADFRRKSLGGKENQTPEYKTTHLLYPARPARSVYNSPLIKTNRQPLWKSPPAYAATPTTDSIQRLSRREEFNIKSPPLRESLSDYAKHSPPFGFEIQNIDVIKGDSNAKRTALIGHRLYPSLPRNDCNDGVKSLVEEKDLKEHSNRSTANARQNAHCTPTEKTQFYFKACTESNSPSESGNLKESSPYLKCFQKNDLNSVLASHDNPPEKVEDKQTPNMTSSENDIEDTYDMDRFLEEALGSALNLNSTMFDEKEAHGLPEDSFHSLESFHTYNKIHTTSTLRSSMRLVKPVLQNDAPTDRINFLLTEAERQQQVIAQASKAINTCRSSKAFSSSLSLVEAERLLLLATLRHKAALDEVKGLAPSPSESSEEFKGHLCILEVSVPLKDNRSGTLGKSEQCNDLWFVCLFNCGQQVLASDAVILQPGATCITFSGALQLSDLPSSFVACLQIYMLRIYKAQEPVRKSKMSKVCRLLRRQSTSCLGPAASSEQLLHLRTPAFALSGTISVDVSNVGTSGKQNLCLEKVPLMSPLQGSAWVQMETSLTSKVQFSGFLTLRQNSGGSCAWQRRWCRLNETGLHFWNYPRDEDEKDPLEVIDLKSCSSDKIEQAPRHLCARSRTLMLETVRVSAPNDINSTIMECNSDHTVIRYFLSCDSVSDMNEWASILNKVVTSMKLWNIKERRIHQKKEV